MKKILLLSFAIMSCAQPQDGGDTQGKYEAMDATEAQKYIGRLTPVPEYAPVSTVVIAKKLGRPDFKAAIEKAGAIALEVDSDSYWARDWSGFSAHLNGKTVLAEFNYYPDRPEDDAVPQEIEKRTNLKRVSIPVYLEGGNFMSNDDGLCLLSDWAVEEQKLFEDEYAHLQEIKIGADPDKFSNILKKHLGCKSVAILPRMPGEGTGHIDMWAKLISNKTVLVNELELASNPTPSAKILAKYLNDRAEDMRKLKLEVIRLPMPKPTGAVFRSYTNFLQVNGHALVPAYGPAQWEVKNYSPKATERRIVPGQTSRDSNVGGLVKLEFRPPPIDQNSPDVAKFQEMEERVKAILEKKGLIVTYLPSEKLIQRNGSIHCTTMQISK